MGFLQSYKGLSKGSFYDDEKNFTITSNSLLDNSGRARLHELSRTSALQ